MYDRITLVFCLSYDNPFTGRKMRAYRKDGINGFIHECYTSKNAESNKFIADHHIAYCDVCHKNHSIFGLGKTPSEAYKDCKKDADNFVCPGPKVFEFIGE